ncbi:MAG TPA: DUF6077 domain-containing protein [Nocardioidaceae bacterium]|nr:DUF6077 domain-containing protein [Nocardioidaceae bacterium]
MKPDADIRPDGRLEAVDTARSHIETRSADPLWVEVVHAVLDGSIVAFGVWTLLYEVAAAAQSSASAATLIWIPLAVLSMALCVWRVLRHRRADPSNRSGLSDPETAATDRENAVRSSALVRPVLAGLATLLALGAAGIALVWPEDHFLWMWAALLLAALAALGRVVVAGPVSWSSAWASNRSHLFALLLVVALAVFTMFVRNGDPDDIYYVNRSVWTAAHDTFSLRDTMFGPETFPASYGGGIPIASIEGLLGAMAGLLGVSAAGFSYLVAAPIACLLAGWATWRLVALWAPRRPVLLLAGAFAFSLMSATGAVGDFSYARMWTGKVMALCIVLPLAWTYFTRVAAEQDLRRNRWNLFMLTMCGLAFAGFTPTAVIMAPVMSAAVVLAAILTRNGFVRQLLGAVAFSVAPLVAGLAVLLFSTGVGGAEPRAPQPWRAFDRTMGDDPWIVALAVLAMVVGPLLVRSRIAAAMAGSATLAVVVLLVPGFSVLLNDLTGAGVLYYRLILVAPVAVLVGMLLALPVPTVVPAPARAVLVGGLTLALAVVLTVGGTAVWDKEVGGHIDATPELKLSPKNVHDVQQVLELDEGDLVLLPRAHMSVLPIYTTETYPVVPRPFYLEGLQESPEQLEQRMVLSRFSNYETDRLPPQRRFERALEGLGVSMVCVYRGKQSERLEMVKDAGYVDPQRAGRLVCLSAP